MTTTHALRGDHAIQNAVRLEAEWTPEVTASDIGVSVAGGVVTLSGHVGTLAERVAMTKAAQRVRGVTTVVDDLSIDSSYPVPETEVAKQVQQVLGWTANVPKGIKAEVVHHRVTLTGEVHWDFQRQAAVRAVRAIQGVYGVEDQITLAPRPNAADTEERIREALVRNASLDASTTKVTVHGSAVMLTGHVRSWMEKEQAGRAAWMSPNVTEVRNDLAVVSG